MSKGSENKKENDSQETSINQHKKCFVIMPIADREGYPEGHFGRVYKELVKPAIEDAGFIPERADDTANTKVIILSILKSIVEYDMAICDLSSLNPNVMYELGVRQMAKKPVTLIKDEKTNRIFDIGLMSDIAYDSSLRVDLVRIAKEQITNSIIATYEQKDSNSNSLLELLSIHLQVESKAVPVSVAEKLILQRLDSISLLIASDPDFELLSNTPSSINRKSQLSDAYGTLIKPNLIVYGPSSESVSNGTKCFFYVEKIIRYLNESNDGRNLYKLELYNLESKRYEIISRYAGQVDYLVVSSEDLAVRNEKQFEEYLAYNRKRA